MFHVTIPHPSPQKQHLPFQKSETSTSSAKHKAAAAAAIAVPRRSRRRRRWRNPTVMGLVRLVQFTGPIVGIMVYVASLASEDWIVSEKSLHRWGLFSKCEPEADNATTVTCVYMSPRENPDYYQAAQAMGCVAVVVYAVLQFHFVLISLKVCYHQLPALLSVFLTVLLVILLLLVGTNYSDDTRWETMEPSLGWSFWASVAVAVCSFVTSAVLIYRGYEERNNPSETDERSNQVHPSKPSRAAATDGSSSSKGDIAGGVPGEDRGTQSSLPQESDTSAERPQRSWKRRLSPIPERGQLPVVPETEEEEALSPRDSCSAASRASE